MADQTVDPRLETLLRGALRAEAARLPLTVRPDQVLERGRARRNARRDWRRILLGESNGGLLRLSAAVGVVVVLVVAGVVALSTLSQVRPIPAAALPTSPADWSRVEIQLPLDPGGIARIAAGERGLIAVTRPDESGMSRVLFSTDGHAWSLSETSARGEYVSLVATDRGFLMIDEDGTSTSENGLDWQRVAGNWSGGDEAGGAIVVNAIAGGPGYVAIGSDNKAWYSADGSEWTAAQMPPPPAEFIRPEYPELTVDLMQVAAVGDHLVAIGYVYAGNSQTSITEDIVVASSDGKTWSTVLPDIGDRAGQLQLAASPTGFLVIGGPLDGTKQSKVWQSADGETWQELATYNFNSGTSDSNCTPRTRISHVAAASSGYVAVGTEHECMSGDIPASPPQAVVWTSHDGASWSRLPGSDPFIVPESPDSLGTSAGPIVAWGSRFVIGGQYGGQPAVWLSGRDGALATPTTIPGPTASASVAPTLPSPAAGNSTFTSTIHGISIDYPSTWQTRAATEPWTGGPLHFDSPAADLIFDPALGDRLYMILASQPLGHESDETWRDEQVGWLCSGDGGAFGSSSVDGVGAFVISCGSTQSAAVIPSGLDPGPQTATRGYVMRLVVSSQEPELVGTYDWDWHKGVLETVDLRPDDAIDASPTAEPSTAATPEPQACRDVEAGTLQVRQGPITINVTLPEGWHVVEDSRFHAADGDCRVGDRVEFELSLVGWVHRDSCRWRGAPIEVDTPAGVVQALAAQPGHETSGPIETTLGGYAATMFEFTSIFEFESTDCEEGGPFVSLWKEPGAGAAAPGEQMGPGETVVVYVVDVDGTPLIVATNRDERATPDGLAQLDAVVASVQIER